MSTDVLEQFNTPSLRPAATATPSKLSVPPTAPNAPTSAPNSTSAPGQSQPQSAQTKPKLGLDDLNLSDDFASELAKGMAELMREIAAEAAPGAEGASSEEDKASEVKFRKAWEDMLVGEMNGMEGMDDLLGKGTAEKGKGKDEQKKGLGGDDFQQSIKKAMEKLKESETNLQVCADRSILHCAHVECQF